MCVPNCVFLPVVPPFCCSLSSGLDYGVVNDAYVNVVSCIVGVK